MDTLQKKGKNCLGMYEMTVRGSQLGEDPEA